MADCIELLANALLFLSSLMLLVDRGPHDLFPSYRRRARALQALREHRNIIGPLPANVNLQAGGVPILRDEPTYRTLVEFVRQRWTRADTVDWGRAIGVGYAAVSFPVGLGTLEGFRGVYVLLTSRGDAQALELAPVTHLDDLEDWLRQWRQGNLTRTALGLLALGFLLQLWPAFARWAMPS